MDPGIFINEDKDLIGVIEMFLKIIGYGAKYRGSRIEVREIDFFYFNWIMHVNSCLLEFPLMESCHQQVHILERKVEIFTYELVGSSSVIYINTLPDSEVGFK
jgi:hypothetical protein